MNNAKLILASKSLFRASMLKNAGLDFQAEAASIDERSVEAPLLEADLSPSDIAEVLALAKAEDISTKHSGDLIIGSDQTLSFEGEMLHKPDDMESARRRLLAFSGKTHYLNSAVVLVRDSEVIWRHVETSSITFRTLTPQFVGRHLASVGEIALSSVGAYQIEGEGVQLFDKVEGDFFSVMGLPLIPLLIELRRLGVLES